MRSRISTSVKLLVRVLAGMAFAAVALFGFSDSVSAKGPESATITGPGIDRPIELIDTANPDLVTRLMQQTGLWFTTGDLPRPLEEPLAELGPSYTLAWINGIPPGKSVDERTIVQVIYPDAENGPVIHTPDQEALSGGWGPGVIGWFAAPSGLRDTLAELGVPISAAPSLQQGTSVWYIGVVGFSFVVGLAGALVRLRRSGVRSQSFTPYERGARG